MHTSRMLSPVAMLTGAVVCVHCRGPAPRVPLEPIPLAEAARIVNENTARITGTLRAVGSVDGQFTSPNGQRRSYHLDGVLFYLAPSYLRFDLKTFGERQFLFGSNADSYWFYNQEDDSYHCGRHGFEEDLPAEIPMKPHQIIDALGLSPIPWESRQDLANFQVQRVEAEHQQVLFFARDAADRTSLEKEYWLDRFPPRLVHRVVFRDAEGVVTMESTLDRYRPLHPQGPVLPHSMSAHWPTAGSQMRFQISRWTLEPTVSATSPQFTAPKECRGP